MFEMLGNWSFGDYFKKKRSLGLGILVDVYGIDKDCLYVTILKVMK
jgi:alanyl-tRNA synthetase